MGSAVEVPGSLFGRRHLESVVRVYAERGLVDIFGDTRHVLHDRRLGSTGGHPFPVEIAKLTAEIEARGYEA